MGNELQHKIDVTPFLLHAKFFCPTDISLNVLSFQSKQRCVLLKDIKLWPVNKYLDCTKTIQCYKCVKILPPDEYIKFTSK